MKPETTPIKVHTTRVRTAATPTGILNERAFSSDKKHIVTTDIDITAPIDKSNVAAQNGIRNAKAKIPVLTFSPKTNLALVILKKVSGFHNPKMIMNPPQRYRALKRSNPSRFNKDLFGVANTPASVVDICLPFTSHFVWDEFQKLIACQA